MMIKIISIKYYYRIIKENDIKPDIYNIEEIKKFTSVQKAKVLGIAKSTFYEKKKNKFIVKEKK
ncbi:hypothetical protein NWQ33_04820 [Mycoplasmopsis cynos]|nr:hypothetical protein [Mycoplasmopsis cynos]